MTHKRSHKKKASAVKVLKQAIAASEKRLASASKPKSVRDEYQKVKKKYTKKNAHSKYLLRASSGHGYAKTTNPRDPKFWKTIKSKAMTSVKSPSPKKKKDYKKMDAAKKKQ